jgi:hypothetical protein
VYERPHQIKWFIGLQIVAHALGGVLAVAARNDAGLEIGLPHLVFLLFAYVAVKGFFIWKIWGGKNWARLTMFAWVLYTYIQYLHQLWSGATPIQVELPLKALIVMVAVLQVASFALLFTRPANEWFRPPRTKQSLLFP